MPYSDLLSLYLMSYFCSGSHQGHHILACALGLLVAVRESRTSLTWWPCAFWEVLVSCVVEGFSTWVCHLSLLMMRLRVCVSGRKTSDVGRHSHPKISNTRLSPWAPLLLLTWSPGSGGVCQVFCCEATPFFSSCRLWRKVTRHSPLPGGQGIGPSYLGSFCTGDLSLCPHLFFQSLSCIGMGSWILIHTGL